MKSYLQPQQLPGNQCAVIDKVRTCQRICCASLNAVRTCIADAYPSDRPPRGYSQQGDSVLHMPLIQLASEMGPKPWLLPTANVSQGATALPGCDHKRVHWLQWHHTPAQGQHTITAATHVLLSAGTTLARSCVVVSSHKNVPSDIRRHCHWALSFAGSWSTEARIDRRSKPNVVLECGCATAMFCIIKSGECSGGRCN